MGASYGEIGLIGGLRAVPYAFLPLVAGYLADRMDKVKLYLLASLLAALGSALLFLSQDLVQAAAANLIFGIHMVFYWPIAEIIIADALPEEERWRAYTRYSVAWSLSYVIGPLIGGWIGEILGIRSSFIAGAIIASVSAPMVLMMGSIRASRIEERVHRSAKSLLIISPIYVSVLIFTVGMASVFSLAPSYLSEIGWTTAGIGILFTIYGASRTSTYYLLSRTGRRSHTALILVAVVIQAASLALLYTGDTALTVISFLIGGATTGAYFTASFDLISRSIPHGYKGLALGLFETIVGVGFIAGPTASGPLMDVIGASETFLGLSFFALLGTLLTVHLKRLG